MKKLLIFLLLGTIAMMAGCGPAPAKKEGTFRIVTSFYPIYIDAANIAQGIDGVEVINMTKPQTGCLHDYQLTTEDMKTLETADVFIINGLGMESFMEKAMGTKKDLKVIDASKSEKIQVLKDGDEPNPHVWMSVTYAMAQAKAITSQLCEADPAHEKEYANLPCGEAHDPKDGDGLTGLPTPIPQYPPLTLRYGLCELSITAWS